MGTEGLGLAEGFGHAIRWSAEGGAVGLGFLPGDSVSQAFDVSADGSVVVGWSAMLTTAVEAFRWTAESGMVGLGFLRAEHTSSEARGVSADGSVVAGSSGWPYQAFRWTAETGMVSLGAGTKAYGVSADGSAVVGRGQSAEAFRWTAEGGMVSLGWATRGGVADISVSADGSTVVGDSARDVYRWTAETGAVNLGTLPAPRPLEAYRNEVYGVCGDGSLVVGTLLQITTRPSDDPVAAWIWDESHGMRNLNHVLTDDFGLDLSDWWLTEARDISDDGRVIVGIGWHPTADGRWTAKGYRAVIPEPSTCVLVCSALAWLLAYAGARRRRT